MSITLNLAPEKEERLRHKALALGQQAESYVAELVLRDIEITAEPEAQTPPLSLAEMLAGRIGLFESDGPGYEAQEAKKAFVEHLSEKHQSSSL